MTSTAGLRPSGARPAAPREFGRSLIESVDGPDLVAGIALFAGAVLFYALPWPALYLPALAVTFAAALWRPVLSLALVPAFSPFFMDPKHIGHLQPAPQEIFLGVAVVALAVRTMVRPCLAPQWRRLVLSPFALPGVIFVAAACVSSVLAQEHHLAFRALYQVVFEPVLFFALLTLFVQRDSDWWFLILTTVCAGIVVSCVGMGQLLTGQGVSLVPNTAVQRVKAFYGSPDNLGLFLDRVMPFWGAAALFARWLRWERFLWVVVGLPMAVALVYTFSRGAWFALAAVLIAYLSVRPGWTRWTALGLVVLALLGIGFKSHSLVRFLQTGHAGTAQKRIDIWHSSLNMIRDHPIAGIGLDNFQHYYAPRPHQQLYSPDCPRGRGYLIDNNLSVSQEPCLSHPHNEFLDAWLSTGILGLVAFVWLEVVFWRLIFASRRGSRPLFQRVMVLGAAGAMLAALLHGLVDNGYFLMDLSVLFWLLCALAQHCAHQPDLGLEPLA